MAATPDLGRSGLNPVRAAPVRNAGGFVNQLFRVSAGSTLLPVKLADRFRGTIGAFMALAESTKHYPCAKKAWVEFLREVPTAWTDRMAQ